jgi:hypothetical protein
MSGDTRPQMAKIPDQPPPPPPHAMGGGGAAIGRLRRRLGQRGGRPAAAPRAPRRPRWRKQPPCPSPNPRRERSNAWSGTAAAVSRPRLTFSTSGPQVFLRLFSFS